MAKEETAAGYPLHFRPVRTHEVAEAGDSARRLVVDCPRVLQPLALDACVGCPYHAGAFLDPDGTRSTVVCRYQQVMTQLTLPRNAGDDGRKGAQVNDLMTVKVHSLRTHQSAADAARLLLEYRVGGAPVVDAENRPVGMVSKTDLLRVLHERVGELEGATQPTLPPLTVAEIMRPVRHTLQEEAPLAQAAALMAVEHIHRVPIVGADGKLVGIVSALDIVRWVAREGGYLAPARDAEGDEP